MIPGGVEHEAFFPEETEVIDFFAPLREDFLSGGVEHEAFFPEDTEVIDFFAPVREDFLTGEIPPYMAQR